MISTPLMLCSGHHRTHYCRTNKRLKSRKEISLCWQMNSQTAPCIQCIALVTIWNVDQLEIECLMITEVWAVELINTCWFMIGRYMLMTWWGTLGSFVYDLLSWTFLLSQLSIDLNAHSIAWVGHPYQKIQEVCFHWFAVVLHVPLVWQLDEVNALGLHH